MYFAASKTFSLISIDSTMWSIGNVCSVDFQRNRRQSLVTSLTHTTENINYKLRMCVWEYGEFHRVNKSASQWHKFWIVRYNRVWHSFKVLGVLKCFGDTQIKLFPSFINWLKLWKLIYGSHWISRSKNHLLSVISKLKTDAWKISHIKNSVGRKDRWSQKLNWITDGMRIDFNHLHLNFISSSWSQIL